LICQPQFGREARDGGAFKRLHSQECAVAFKHLRISEIGGVDGVDLLRDKARADDVPHVCTQKWMNLSLESIRRQSADHSPPFPGLFWC
jgi:hypothetical protein